MRSDLHVAEQHHLGAVHQPGVYRSLSALHGEALPRQPDAAAIVLDVEGHAIIARRLQTAHRNGLGAREAPGVGVERTFRHAP